MPRNLSTAAFIYFRRGVGKTKVARGYSSRVEGSSILLLIASPFLNSSWNTCHATRVIGRYGKEGNVTETIEEEKMHEDEENAGVTVDTNSSTSSAISNAHNGTNRSL